MLARYVRAFGLSAVLHVLVAAVLVWLMRPGPPTRDSERTITVVVQAAAEDDAYPGLNPVDREKEDWNLKTDSGGSLTPLALGDLNFDIDKIAERAPVLFPFVTPGLLLEHFLPSSPPRKPGAGLESPFVAGSARRPSRGRPLALNDAALQSLVDKTWSRRDRWTAFEPIRRLADRSSPDAGRLPTLLKKYCDENWLQPYMDTTIRDPRLWVQLTLAADHVTFIGYIRRYASAHPSTEATTELLFLLDKIAQASRDTLGLLLDTDPTSRLAWTRQENPRAYKLINQLRDRYARELSRIGLTTGAALDEHYDAVRLAILTGIVGTSPNGYGANDARFLIGAIHWRAQRTDEALRWWRRLTANLDGSYAIASSQIQLALRAAKMERPEDGANVDDPLRREVDRILKNEQGRWLSFSFDRLKQFGYRFDTY